MTVGELIHKLEEFNPEREVMLACGYKLYFIKEILKERHNKLWLSGDSMTLPPIGTEPTIVNTKG